MTGSVLCTECSRPARGKVPKESVPGLWVMVPAHLCFQCASHCLLTRYLVEHQADEDALRSVGVWS